jgi:Flp pilus assembly protein TadD
MKKEKKQPQIQSGRAWWPVALIVAVGLLAYANSFSGPFIFDDLMSIRDNPRVKAPGAVWEGLTTTSRPVVWLTLAFNYAAGGLNVWGFHVVNLLIHLGAAWVLFGVVRRALKLPVFAGRYDRAANGIGLAVAVLWVAHPLNTQAVTYIIQRGESLMGLFYLATIYCVVRRWMWGAVACCALGMATKPIMVTAPIVAIVFDWMFMGGSWRQRWKLAAGLAATWLLLPVLLANGAKEWKPDAGFEFGGVTAWEYARSQPGVLLHYLRLVVWPRPLVLDYGWPVARTAGDILPGCLVIGGLLAGTVWALVKRKPLGFVGVWFFAILLPTSSFIPIRDLAFEHRMYLPLAGVLAALVVAGREWLKERGVGVVALVTLVLVIMTSQRNLDYRDDLTVWRDVATKRPENARGRYNYGVALHFRKQTTEAIEQYREAIRLRPDYADAHYTLGVALASVGSHPEAVKSYREAVRIHPNYPMAYHQMGISLAKLGDRQSAKEAYREAVRLSAINVEARLNLGSLLFDEGKLDDAAAVFADAIKINPNSAEAQFNLGLVRHEQKREGDAEHHYREALRLKPGHAEAHNNLGAVLFAQGKVREAAQHFAEAVRLKRGYVEAQRNLEAIKNAAGGH